MEYTTVVAFNDLQDEDHRYEKGDIYPRKGLKPPKKRIKELSTVNNSRGIILIEEVQDHEQNDT